MSEIRRERRVLGRYLLADAIAAGGMATIHLGRLLGPVGFARTVAIKRLHPQFAKDPEFVAAFLDEARLAARIHHPNVAQTLDVVATDGELFLVMEYVSGESLSQLLKRLRKRDSTMPSSIASAVVTNALYGLHAAHEAKSEDGEPLRIVHRDVSPHNILVGVDGAARVVDFGIAKAAKRSKETEVGRIKGKIAYMSPEQVKSQPLDRRSDVFSAGIVLWETLTGRRLFEDTDPFLVMSQVLEAPLSPPSRLVPGISPELDAVVMRALARDREARFQTAREMAIAIEHALPPALGRQVGDWVEATVGDELERRGQALERLQREEGSESGSVAPAESEATADYQHSVVAELAPPVREPPTEVTTPMRVEPVPAPKRATFNALVGIAAGVVLFTLLVVAAITTRGGDEAPAVAAPSPTAPSAPPPVEPNASAEPTAVAPPPSIEPTPPKPAPSSKPVVRPSKPPKIDCNPPYWVDAEGIKHYKKDCKLR
ncbi:MAG: serine/threonine protein kinase [Polyangiaceae bacterium]|nr:serine/threonine protein kinase [Polyangiaceae bacterium]MCL4756144.1 serine/threonine protein kinase [Myxococcales bacterium]